MSWNAPHEYPPPPQGYPPPPSQYQQPYQQQQPYPSPGPSHYGSHSQQPSQAPYPPQSYPAPAMNQQYFNQNQGYPTPPPPPVGNSPYPPGAGPYHPPGAGYGSQPGFQPPSNNPYPPPQGQSPWPAQQQHHQAPQSGPPGPPAPYSHHASSSFSSNPNRDAEALRKAMQGFGTNEAELIRVLSSVPDPQYMAQVSAAFQSMYRRNLKDDIHKETSGYFRESLEAIVLGPLKSDVISLYDAIHGLGTKERVLNDVLLGRSNVDLSAVKAEYQSKYRVSLEKDVSQDLSFSTERLFMEALKAERAPEHDPVHPQMLERDAGMLHDAIERGLTKDHDNVISIFTRRSDGQLRAIAQAFQQRYRRPLRETISKRYNGHMRDALLRMLAVAEDRAKADADNLEDAMAGMGTKDKLLLSRIVRLHWDKQHLHQVKAAYRHFYHKDLATRVGGETSRYYRDLLVALCGSG